MKDQKSDRDILQAARGMRDILPDEPAGYARIEHKAREVFSLFGYGEIRTPVLESVALFERAIGATTDIVEKQMFTLKDRGDRVLCLRPEGTAGVVRAYIENVLEKDMALAKLFYIGPMFRSERPQKGRYREFSQIGSEYFGNGSPGADAETVTMVRVLLESFGVRSPDTRLNSIGCSDCRPGYQKKLLEYLRARSNSLCDNCRSRIEKNPLRALDCKEDADKLEDAPRTLDNLCDNCRRHHEEVTRLLGLTGTPFRIFPRLVRGLDYYTRTVFEVYPSGQSGSQDALAAGGRYDRLVEDMGGGSVPAVGFALGIERVAAQVREGIYASSTDSARSGGVFVATAGKGTYEKSFQILHELRGDGIPAEGGLNSQSLKSQMRLADRLGMRFCLIVGEDELKNESAQLRDLRSQSQKIVPLKDLRSILKKEWT